MVFNDENKISIEFTVMCLIIVGDASAAASVLLDNTACVSLGG